MIMKEKLNLAQSLSLNNNSYGSNKKKNKNTLFNQTFSKTNKMKKDNDLKKSISISNESLIKANSTENELRSSLETTKSNPNLGIVRRWHSEKYSKSYRMNPNEFQAETNQINPNENSQNNNYYVYNDDAFWTKATTDKTSKDTKEPEKLSECLTRKFSRIAFKKKGPRMNIEASNSIIPSENEINQAKIDEKSPPLNSVLVTDNLQKSFDFNSDANSLDETLYDYLNSIHRIKQSITQLNLVKAECQICFETHYLSERKCCQFKACSDCINFYIKMQIVDRNLTKIDCLNCSKPINHFEIIQRMASYDETTLKKYSKSLKNKNILKKPNCKECPRCSAPTKLKHKNILEKLKNKFGEKKVKCNQCHLEWCFKCHAPWHNGITCDDYMKNNNTLKHWAKDNAQLCPICKIYIQRDEGCDHMICTNCQTEFCYKCGLKFRKMMFIGDHFSKYSILGCKYRLYPNSPIKRKLIRGVLLMGGTLLMPFVGAFFLAACASALVIAIAVLPCYGLYKIMLKKNRGDNNKSNSIKSDFRKFSLED